MKKIIREIIIYCGWYTCRESNPNLKNRNLPFYPLNYKCIYFAYKDTNKKMLFEVFSQETTAIYTKLRMIHYICNY